MTRKLIKVLGTLNTIEIGEILSRLDANAVCEIIYCNVIPLVWDFPEKFYWFNPEVKESIQEFIRKRKATLQHTNYVVLVFEKE